MTKMLRYDTAEYAGNRLNESIVSYKGEPIRVNACGDTSNGIVVRGEYIQNGDTVKVLLKDIDLTPVTLGFVNTNRGIGYLARVPLRRDWKQGLRMNNLRSLYGIRERILRDIDLYKVIKGVYPSFQYALENTVNDGVARAFSRNFAIVMKDDNPMIVYKYHGIVGYIKDGRPILISPHECLMQELEGSLDQ